MKTSSIVALAAIGLFVSTAPGYSQYSGIFGTGVAITSDIGGISAFKLYEMTLIGDGRLAPLTSGGGSTLGTPSLVSGSAWASGGGPSLGSFIQGVDTLTLNGGEDLTYKGGGADVTGAQVFYQVDGGLFNQITLSFNQDNVPGGSFGDQRWYYDGANVNLAGLSVGTHTLSVYFRDNNTVDGNDYISNFGANFNSSFTIAAAPEPTTGLLVASGLGLFFLIRRR